MVSVSHPNARMYFERDAECLRIYFARKFHLSEEETGAAPTFDGGGPCRLQAILTPREPALLVLLLLFLLQIFLVNVFAMER